MAQGNFSIFSATTPKVQFYHSNKTRNHTKEERKGERREGREKKELAYLVLLYRLLWRRETEREKPQKRQNGQNDAILILRTCSCKSS